MALSDHLLQATSKKDPTYLRRASSMELMIVFLLSTISTNMSNNLLSSSFSASVFSDSARNFVDTDFLLLHNLVIICTEQIFLLLKELLSTNLDLVLYRNNRMPSPQSMDRNEPTSGTEHQILRVWCLW